MPLLLGRSHLIFSLKAISKPLFYSLLVPSVMLSLALLSHLIPVHRVRVPQNVDLPLILIVISSLLGKLPKY